MSLVLIMSIKVLKFRLLDRLTINNHNKKRYISKAHGFNVCCLWF